MENFMPSRNTFAMFVTPKISEYRYRSRYDYAAAKKIIEAHGRVTSTSNRLVVGSSPTFSNGGIAQLVEQHVPFRPTSSMIIKKGIAKRGARKGSFDLYGISIDGVCLGTNGLFNHFLASLRYNLSSW
ncbi:hypothetical protein WMW72_23560 [Paenibacillus filicis]|uniref:Uncharacterized protein n=1 Tax=Paenibacillus filicis TaxID=669464 RepID=A0ABU9DT34_9BACL